ncbi:hypothetical protein HY948_05310 [Candidatus Gottesmanbacteria bacterium]|nr:hypothetical protein [Candidatus Gottesmanbacteria bacterium]
MMVIIKRFLKTYKGIVISVGMLLLTVLSIVYGVIPASGRIVMMMEQRMELLSETASLQNKLTVLEELDEANIRNSLLIALSAIPQDKSIPSIFSTVERTAVVSGVAIETITIGNPGSLATESAKKQSSEEKKLGSGILPLTAVITGTPKQIRDFLDTIVNVRRFLRISSAEITFFSGANATLRIGLEAFWAPIPASLGDTASPLSQLTEKEEALSKSISVMPSFSGAELGPSAASQLPGPRDPFAL